MVLPSWRAVDFPTPDETTTIGSARYDVTVAPGFVRLRAQHQSSSARVNLLAVLRCYAQPSDTVQFVQAGVEVLTTRGRDLDFSLTRFAVTTKGTA
ncbi:MAG TPA: hypothetical protein VH914_00525 [Acidimicrobiia bacterium]|nr:hypothetical protein [Acidimicrobiia bacterium]